MRSEEAEAVLRVASTYTSRRYTQIDAKAWAESMPEWVSSELAMLAVDVFFDPRNQTLDGQPPTMAPKAFVECCQYVRSKLPDSHVEDDTISRPNSREGRLAAAFNSVVEKTFNANPELDFRGSDYYWGLHVARGVLNGENNLKGQPYVQ